MHLSEHHFSRVEKAFLMQSSAPTISTKIPYLLAENFPQLGLMTACRFLEWVCEHPDGVVSLPTGKTPEYFIKWTKYLLNHWNESHVSQIRETYGLQTLSKPRLDGLTFVQIDEFYPISGKQKNSFYHYVNQFYIQGLGMDRDKALLIDSEAIPLAAHKHFSEIFPDNKVDLSLRFRAPLSNAEELQQTSIFMIDQWCSDYEQQIRNIGGIGFFLGGIGPDGHIAFNTKGSPLYSVTRLTETNFETQAVAAGDLGGIEVSSNRLVITIGLETITYNPDATAIIIAAGEAKAGVIKEALESPMSVLYPASVLQKLPLSRFYLTKGAAIQLTDSIASGYTQGSWTPEKTEKAILNLCKKLHKYSFNLTLDDLKEDPYTSMIPNVSLDTVAEVRHRILSKLEKGITVDTGQSILHTGPHHDDISLGILPYITPQLQEITNTLHFSVLTSGFTAVTNAFILDVLHYTQRLIAEDQIQMISYPDFFQKGYLLKMDKDVYHYLTHEAAEDDAGKMRGLCHRMVRALVSIFEISNLESLHTTIQSVIRELQNSYDGEKNSPKIQKLKGMIREFEEELVWAHFGVQVRNVHHLRLGFYTGDIFTAQPEKNRDVLPVLDLLRKVNPSIISLTLDPEGSGPDTHYKVLQATAAAVNQWSKEKDLSHLRIIGYRNVWHKFESHEATTIIPVSLGDMAVMEDSFANCYLTQVNASFPSYLHNGKFSTIARRIWVSQLKDIQLLLGKNFFYEHPSAKVRASHGLIFIKEMDVPTFLSQARALEQSMEGDTLPGI
jgi:glucosamine-6-phosphate deaminase